jgi:hypothetical protein
MQNHQAQGAHYGYLRESKAQTKAGLTAEPFPARLRSGQSPFAVG